MQGIGFELKNPLTINCLVMRKIIILILLIGLGLGFSLCHKPDTMVNGNETETSKDVNELDVNDNFKWKAIKDIQVSLSSSTNDVVYIKSDKGDVYLKALLKSGQRFDTKITIPTYVTEVTVVCKNQSQKVSVVDKKIDLSFN